MANLRDKPTQLWSSPRCGARTRSGAPCRSPAVRDRPKCRMHGCAPGSGGPPGERNGMYRTGRFTREAKALSRVVRDLAKAADEFGARVMHAHGLKPHRAVRRKRHVQRALRAAKEAKAKGEAKE
jgi:hypothetical protein